jgi:hypothetical protein
VSEELENYPQEYFQAEIKAFELIKFENRAAEYLSVGRVDVVARPPYPWDDEISTLLKPLDDIDWNVKDRWQNRIKKRIEKLRHKLNAIRYHIYYFRNYERKTEEEYKTFLVANNTLNKIMDNPHLIHNTESFLFQSKSCLDVFAQAIVYCFKFEVKTYGNDGDNLIHILKEAQSKGYSEYAQNVIEIIQKNKPWIKELVKMRDEVTHYSDLENLSCFLIKRSNGNDKVATIYYPAMPDGERVSNYMNKTWTNMHNLIQESAYPLINAARIVKQNSKRWQCND